MHTLFNPSSADENDLLRFARLSLSKLEGLDAFTFNTLKGKVTDNLSLDDTLGHFVCATVLFRGTDRQDDFKEGLKRVILALASKLPQAEQKGLLKLAMGESVMVKGGQILVPLADANIEIIERDRNNKIVTDIKDLNVQVSPSHASKLYERKLDKGYWNIAGASKGLTKAEVATIQAACPKVMRFVEEYSQRDNRPPLIGFLSKVTSGWRAYLSAQELVELVKEYDASTKWEKTVAKDILSKGDSALETTLMSNLSWLDVLRFGKMLKFRLKPKGRYKTLQHVNRPEDLLVIPCIRNIVRYMENNGGTRWEKLALATLMLHCNLSPDSIVEFFSRFPWFNREASMREINYEAHNPNSIPPSCASWKDQDMVSFCEPGCEYNLYRLPFPQSTYDKIDPEKSPKRSRKTTKDTPSH